MKSVQGTKLEFELHARYGIYKSCTLWVHMKCMVSLFSNHDEITNLKNNKISTLIMPGVEFGGSAPCEKLKLKINKK